MRVALLLLAAFCALLANTNEKIRNQTTYLESSKDLEKQLNKKLDDLAGDIIGGEKSVKQTDDKMKELIMQIAQLENSAKSAGNELDELVNQNKNLTQSQKDIQKSIVRIISDEFSFDLIMPKEYAEGEDSIIATEILSKLNSVLKDDFNALAKQYESTQNLRKTQNDKIEGIKSNLKNFKFKQAELVSLQDKQMKTLANLKRDKEIYQKQLSRLQAQQDEIRKTLEELKIVAKRESEEAKKALAAQKAAEAKAQKNKKDKKGEAGVSASEGDVKQFGSSYQTSLVKKYSGEKTIAPLDGFTVKQKFGNYVDPIYNIKIFNESVVLSANSPDAKVKSVFNGKVVFAKETAMLDKVVIIENPNGIHTIYAHLSQIAPTVKVGAKVQKGYVIGRVQRDLTFEVTQKNYHIDPLEIIGLK